MRPTILYMYPPSYPAISASEAMKRVTEIGGDAVRPFVLAYTPDFCGFVDWREAEGDEDGKFLPLDKGKADGGKAIENIFELRCFCPAFELRWVREGNTEKGKAVLLCDSESGLSLPGAKCEDGIQALEGEYLLWGQGEKRGERVRLCDHRIGELPVPLDVKKKGRVLLTFTEYFKPDEYGNLTFLAERLTGLQPATEAEILNLAGSE